MSSKKILLSILIPSVPERLSELSNQVNHLTKQVGNEPVEILTFLDNKKRTTGRKRNELLNLSQGSYVVFVDDDDTLSDDYVSSLLGAIRAHPDSDCIVFDVMFNDIKKNQKTLVKYGVEYPHGFDKNKNQYTRKPNHLMCFSRQLALSVKYRDISYKEDDRWEEIAHKKICNQTRIEKVLYTYDFVPKPNSWYAK
jgi:glycosyltransferase involved in cell wall biosynthesis